MAVGMLSLSSLFHSLRVVVREVDGRSTRENTLVLGILVSCPCVVSCRVVVPPHTFALASAAYAKGVHVPLVS